MYHFSVSFNSPSPDDKDIKAFFRSRPYLTGLSIACDRRASQRVSLPVVDRSDVGAYDRKETAPSRGYVRDFICERLKDGRVTSVRDVHEALPDVPYATVARTLLDLSKAGILKKLRHGLYQDADAPPLSKREFEMLRSKHKKRSGSVSDEEILGFLQEPRKPKELQDFLGVSRQRADQVLKSLVTRKLLYRGSHDGYSVFYCTDQKRLAQAVVDRATGFSANADSVLKVLPDRPIFLEDILSHMTISSVSVRRGLRELEGAGLIETMQVVKRLLVSLTQDGLEHPGRGNDTVQASACRLSDLVGHPRTEILHVLKVMGSMPTRNITFALQGVYPELRWSLTLGQIIDRLDREGLIETLRDTGTAQPERRLTDHGNKLMS